MDVLPINTSVSNVTVTALPEPVGSNAQYLIRDDFVTEQYEDVSFKQI